MVSGTNNMLAFGFEQDGDAPSSGRLVQVRLGTGSTLPDYPKLGDSQHFGIIGINLFNSQERSWASNILAFKKPPAGTRRAEPRCSDNKAIPTSAGAFTPMPANEIDTNATGWVGRASRRRRRATSCCSVQGHAQELDTETR